MTERPQEPRQWSADETQAERAAEALREEIRAAKEKSRRYRAGLRAVGRLSDDPETPGGD